MVTYESGTRAIHFEFVSVGAKGRGYAPAEDPGLRGVVEGTYTYRSLEELKHASFIKVIFGEENLRVAFYSKNPTTTCGQFAGRLATEGVPKFDGYLVWL